MRSKTAHSGSEPTEKQIERDVRGLLHGTKEGKIVIENENPSKSGGVRRVVDRTHPDDGTVRSAALNESKG
jgi:hypothetical protein